MGGRTQSRIVPRVIAAVLIFAAVFYAPHWLIAAAMGVICAFVFANFYELLFAALFLDVLYGGPLAWLGGFAYPFTLLALGLLLVVSTLKTQLRFNAFQD